MPIGSECQSWGQRWVLGGQLGSPTSRGSCSHRQPHSMYQFNSWLSKVTNTIMSGTNWIVKATNAEGCWALEQSLFVLFCFFIETFWNLYQIADATKPMQNVRVGGIKAKA